LQTVLKLLEVLFPVPSPEEKLKTWERLLILSLLLLLAASAVYFSGAFGAGFYWGSSSLFGGHQVYCPGCGGTRAFELLLRGNLVQAWRYNQLFILSLPIILYGCLILLRAMATGYPLGGDSIRLLWVWGYLALVLLFMVLRNIPLPILDYLRPPQ
jgi:hypothetical protein